jgi:hypothetical protein
MSIKELFDLSCQSQIDSEFVTCAKEERKELSNQDKKALLAIISKFKIQDIDITLRAIKIYAIWEPDNAITAARKKGVFRYKAYGFKTNIALYLLKELLNVSALFEFSIETTNYLLMKKNLSWIYEFYKDSENKLVDQITKRHANRIRVKRSNLIVENALFKDLLAYIDLAFYKNIDNSEYIGNKNILKGYCKEDVCDAISYMIFLYDTNIGIQQDKHYFIDAEYVQSDEIEKGILIACKVLQIQEWELCIDYLDYKVRLTDNHVVIYDPTNTLEKSIRLGYINREMQETISYNMLINASDNVLSISDVSKTINDELEDSIVKSIEDGKLTRFIFTFPEPIFEYFKKQKGFFKEEIMVLQHFAKELMLEYEEVHNKPITEHCTLTDILLFQRFFVLINEIITKMIYGKKFNQNKNKIISSLIPAFNEAKLSYILTNFIEDEQKIKELLDLFTYKKSYKLDLQYTPFISVSGNLITSSMVFAKSNLIRNAIAYSYLSKNQTANKDQGLEPLVKICSDCFRDAGYCVLNNVKFKYSGFKGEIDVVVFNESDIILIECKSPLSPINNFELRSSIDHIEKANKQLDFSKSAFEDKNFTSEFYKRHSIVYKQRSIKTCIIFGNRLLCGYKKSKHPIRYIYELDMVLKNGVINSSVGEWSVWGNDIYCHQDLLKFLSDETSFTNYTFDAMHKYTNEMFIRGRKISFETYALNMIKSFEIYDEKLRVISKNEKARKLIKEELEKQQILTKL